MADVVGGGTNNVTLYDEDGNALGTPDSPLYTVPASLLGRLRAGIPKPGHTLAQDVNDAEFFYLAEAPAGTLTSATAWDGARCARVAVTGEPTGPWQFASDFAWDDRSTATWL